MGNKPKKEPFHAGVGLTSIILIFVVLVLAAFSVLSLTSARSSMAVTKRNTEYVCAYYNASSEAQAYIAGLKAEGEYIKEFDLDANMALRVAVRVNADGCVTVSEYRVITRETESDRYHEEIF